MNKTLVIFNPTARSDRAGKLRSKIEALSGDPVVRLTTTSGDACRLAAEGVAEGFQTIVAAGGDGTVNEVVNGMAESGSNLGILPVGTMNVFATEIGIPQGNIERAWDVIQQGHARPLDLPQANGHYFIQLAGVGLDATVVQQTTTESKKTLGPLSYLLTLAQVAAVKPPSLIIEGDEIPTREGRFVLIGNGRLYGGPFPLFKKADLHDGLLDIVVFKNQSHWDVVRYFQAIAFGTHLALPDVEYFQASSVRVRSADEVPFELDGEVAGVLPCEFRISPSKLSVLTPINSAA